MIRKIMTCVQMFPSQQLSKSGLPLHVSPFLWNRGGLVNGLRACRLFGPGSVPRSGGVVGVVNYYIGKICVRCWLVRYGVLKKPS